LEGAVGVYKIYVGDSLGLGILIIKQTADEVVGLLGCLEQKGSAD
jgi:hypothetical protein